MKRLKIQVLSLFFVTATAISSCNVAVNFVLLGIEIVGEHVVDSYFGKFLDSAGDKIIGFLFNKSKQKDSQIGTIEPLERNQLLGKSTEDIRYVVHYKKNTQVLTDTITASKDLIIFMRPAVDSTWRLTENSHDFMKKRVAVGTVQIALKTYGYLDISKVNGVLGRKTIEAIKDFQEDHNMPKTGKLTVRTRDSILGIKNTLSIQ